MKTAILLLCLASASLAAPCVVVAVDSDGIVRERWYSASAPHAERPGMTIYTFPYRPMKTVFGTDVACYRVVNGELVERDPADIEADRVAFQARIASATKAKLKVELSQVKAALKETPNDADLIAEKARIESELAK